MGETPQFFIAGGGIAGLSAAIALTSQDYGVTLVERSAAFAEIGAGLQLSPNAWRCLRHWGLEEALRGMCSLPDAIVARSLASGKLLGQLRLGDAMLDRYGAPYGTVLRSDLHRLLLRYARQSRRFSLAMGTQVTALEQVGGHVHVALAGPEANHVETFDAALAADGAGGRLHAFVAPQAPTVASPYTAYRGIIRLSALPQRLRSTSISAWLGHHMHAVTYPVGEEWLNVVLIVTAPLLDHRPQRGAADMHAVLTATTRNQAIHAELQDLVQAIEAHGDVSLGTRWTEWPLMARNPLQSAGEMAAGRIALLGDAAHPMMPFLAQGAAMAIEDAEQLRQSLARHPGDVAAGLAHFANARSARNAKVQKHALRNGRIFHLDGLMACGRNLALRTLAGPVMDKPWLYGGGPIPSRRTARAPV